MIELAAFNEVRHGSNHLHKEDFASRTGVSDAQRHCFASRTGVSDAPRHCFASRTGVSDAQKHCFASRTGVSDAQRHCFAFRFLLGRNMETTWESNAKNLGWLATMAKKDRLHDVGEFSNGQTWQMIQDT